MANQARGPFATVSGGFGNRADRAAAIGGGVGNRAEGLFSTIAGGGPTDTQDASTANRVTDHYGTVGGGGNNQAGDGQGQTDDAAYATVSGGRGNTAGGSYATVTGGRDNAAEGDYSFAAGRRAKVGSDHAGTFVWSDSEDKNFSSTKANQFLIRAAGGVGIGKADPSEALDVVGTVQMTGLKLVMSTQAGSVVSG